MRRPLVGIIGGFATFKIYYLPIVRRLIHCGIDIVDLSPGWLGLNIWPLSTTERRLLNVLQSAGRPVTDIGHSLGGLQAMYLMNKYPSVIGSVIAMASPVYGIRWPSYEQAICATLGINKETVNEFRQSISSVSDRIVTIASTDDEICDTRSCYVGGAINYVISGPGHVLIPFDRRVMSICLYEIHRINRYLS